MDQTALQMAAAESAAAAERHAAAEAPAADEALQIVCVWGVSSARWVKNHV